MVNIVLVQRFMRHRPIVMLLIIFAASLVSRGEAADPSLAAEVERALTRGNAAASKGNWNDAIKHFESARRTAPTMPAPLFNLGLANDRAGGRQLLAIVWYQAFLAVAEPGPNSQKVRARIEQLEAELTRLEREVMGDALSLAQRVRLPDRPQKFRSVGVVQARIGDLKGAWKTVDLIKEISAKLENKMQRWSADHEIGHIIYEIMKFEANAGNFAKALKIVSDHGGYFTFAMGKTPNGAYRDIAISQARQQDTEAAYHTLSRIKKDQLASLRKSEVLLEILKVESKKGNVQGAERAVARISKSLADKKVLGYGHLAVAQGRAGQGEAAYQSLRRAAYFARQIKVLKALNQEIVDVVRLAIEAKELDWAKQRALSRIKLLMGAEQSCTMTNFFYGHAIVNYIGLLAEAGDPEAAWAFALKIRPKSSTDTKDACTKLQQRAFEEFVIARAHAGDVSGAEQALKQLRKDRLLPRLRAQKAIALARKDRTAAQALDWTELAMRISKIPDKIGQYQPSLPCEADILKCVRAAKSKQLQNAIGILVSLVDDLHAYLTEIGRRELY